MQRLSKNRRTRAVVLAAALTLTFGLAASPQKALADEGMEEQDAIVASVDDELVASVDGEQAGELDDVVLSEDPAPAPQQPSADELEGLEGDLPVTPPAEPTEPTPVPDDDTDVDADKQGELGDDDDASVPGNDDESAQGSQQEEAAETAVTVGTDQIADAPAPKTADKTTTDAADAKKSAGKTVKAAADAKVVHPKTGTYIIESGIAASDKKGLAKLVLNLKFNEVKAGTEVITWSYDESNKASCQWYVERMANTDWYVIASAQNKNLVLTATNDRSKLYLTEYEVGGIASQLWSFLSYGTSYGQSYQIRPLGVQKAWNDRTIVYNLDIALAESKPVKVLDVRGGKPDRGADLITYAASSAVKGNQEFYLVETSVHVSAGAKNMAGKYRMLATGTNNAVEVRGAKADNQANVWVYTNNNKAHQDIYLQDAGNGFYVIWDMGTGKVFDVAGGSPLVGTNIIQWSYNGKDNQLWAVRKNADGSITLISKKTGLVFGVVTDKATPASGSNIACTMDVNGRKANTFTLKSYKLITNGILGKIQKIGDTSKALDVSKASTANNAGMSFYKDNGQNNQRFQIFENTNGTYRIRTASSGGWIIDKDGKFVQNGNHATAASAINSWVLTYFKGGLRFTNCKTNKVLFNTSVKVVSAPLTIKAGLYEIHSLVKVNNFSHDALLDDPRSSKTNGTRVNVYPDGNGINQKWKITKSGSSYRIQNYISGLMLATSGDKVALYRNNTNSKDQYWTIGIADGGNIKFINNKNGKVLDITGSGNSVANKSTATQIATDQASREARQSWKLEATVVTGWVNTGKGTFYFDNKGKQVTTSTLAYDLWKMIKNTKSATSYLVAVYPDKPRLVIFKGKAGNWTPIKDWECATGHLGSDGCSITLRGLWKMGEGNGNDEPGGAPLTAEGAATGRSKDLPGFSGCTYGVFIVGAWATHTTKPDEPVADQLNRRISMGCIRLAPENAKWIYNNIPRWTRLFSVPRNPPSNMADILARYGAWDNDEFH